VGIPGGIKFNSRHGEKGHIRPTVLRTKSPVQKHLAFSMPHRTQISMRGKVVIERLTSL